MCRTRHFRWKGQCATEIQLLNTPHDRRCCHGRQATTPFCCSSINTLCFPQKNWRVNFRDRGWGRQRYLPPRLRGDMATPTAIALDSSFNLLLISSILVDTNGNGQHHVIIGINPLISKDLTAICHVISFITYKTPRANYIFGMI